MKDKFGYLKDRVPDSVKKNIEKPKRPEGIADPTFDDDRAGEIKRRDDEPSGGVGIVDVDRAVTEHIDEHFDFHIKQGENEVKVPVIWDSPEKWVWARKQQGLKNVKNKVLLPLVVLDRNSYSKNDQMPTRPEFTRLTPRGRSRTVQARFSRRNRYDKFDAAFNDTPQPEYEVYSVVVPKYVEVDYSLSIFTEKLWQLDTITDVLVHESGTFWGNDFRFHVQYGQITTEVNSGTETRYCEGDISLTVKAYISPKTKKPQKTFTYSEVSITESVEKL